MNVIAWSQNLTPQAAAESGVTYVSKQQLFKQADVLSVHLGGQRPAAEGWWMQRRWAG